MNRTTKRTAVAVVALASALVAVPTVMAFAENDAPERPAATCPHLSDMEQYPGSGRMPCSEDGAGMMARHGIGTMGDMTAHHGRGMMNGSGMMGGFGTGLEDCPWRVSTED
jgi:hypothetical protein